MKIINTLSVLFFLLFAVACTSESDTIMNDIDKEVETTTEKVAVFDISFMSNVIDTKASVSEDDTESKDNEARVAENAISNCFIAALDAENNVVSSFVYEGKEDFTQNGNIATINNHMIIKVPANTPPTLRFYAVANLYITEQYTSSIKGELLGCKTLSAIQEVVFNDEAPTVLVKVGCSEAYSNYKTGTSINSDTYTEVTIPVTQRSAAIELAEFKVVDSNKNEIKEVVVKSLQLLNMKEKAKVGGEYEDSNKNKPQESCRYHLEDDCVNESGYHFSSFKDIRIYAYDNTSDAKTSLKIDYTVNGVFYSRTYTIKTPATNGYTESVVGGKLYQLYVTVGAVSEDIQFKVNDWIPNKIDLGEIEGTLK